MSKHHGSNGKLYTLMKQTCTPGTYCNKHFSNVFGYLAGPAAVGQFPKNKLEDLAQKMKEGNAPVFDASVPAGFAFFGQFIDHDITLDATTQLGKAAGDPNKIENLRTPRLDLDSVYLGGPEGSPYLYKDDKLLIGSYNTHDFMRNKRGTAIIGDPRNDENIFIAQLHILFMRYHNYLINQGKTFEEAKQEVIFTYQYIVVNEFLPAVVEAGTLQPYRDDFLNNQSLPTEHGIDWTQICALPVEFSAAAFRFGHSPIRQIYQVNDQFAVRLFQAGGFMPLQELFNIDWKYFFNIDGVSYQKASKIDTKMAPDLFSLPFAPNAPNLALRNLIRGEQTFQLMHGRAIANDLFNTGPIPIHPDAVDVGLSDMPLWYYVLAEAEQLNGKLGKIGGTIVTGVLLKMLLDDSKSYINEDSTYIPSLPNPNGSYMAGLADMLNGVIV